MEEQFDKYIKQVIKELDDIGFGGLISVINPPQEATATFMATMCLAAFLENVSHENCARYIARLFLDTCNQEIPKQKMN
jgi:hypothetical protein